MPALSTVQMLAVLSMARALLRRGSDRAYVVGMTAAALDTTTDVVADLLREQTTEDPTRWG